MKYRGKHKRKGRWKDAQGRYTLPPRLGQYYQVKGGRWRQKGSVGASQGPVKYRKKKPKKRRPPRKYKENFYTSVARYLAGTVEYVYIEDQDYAIAITGLDHSWWSIAGALKKYENHPQLKRIQLMHVRADYRNEEGREGWNSMSYAQGGSVAVSQAAWTARKWAERYKLARVSTLAFVTDTSSAGFDASGKNLRGVALESQKEKRERERRRQRRKGKKLRGRGPK